MVTPCFSVFGTFDDSVCEEIALVVTFDGDACSLG